MPTFQESVGDALLVLDADLLVTVAGVGALIIATVAVYRVWCWVLSIIEYRRDLKNGW